MPAVGIDLGTTYSCVGIFQHGKVEIIANDQGNRTTPSYVAFTDSERLIGDAAKNQAAMNPSNTVFDAKRLIGRKFNDDAVQSDMKHWSFDVVDESGRPKIEVEFKGEKKRFAAEEISSMILTKVSFPNFFRSEYSELLILDFLIFSQFLWSLSRSRTRSETVLVRGYLLYLYLYYR